MLHKNSLVGDIHVIHNWKVADATALAALTLTVADEGKLAWQVDTDDFWFLANSTVPTWLPCLGVQGPAGQGILAGTVDPTTEGNDGDFYLRSDTFVIFGPKAAGAWPAGVSLIGADGTNGTNGVDAPIGIPQNSQSDAYTCVLADNGKHILHPSADTTARVFTIPANSTTAFEIGSAITFINQNGAGIVTIAITADTMRLAGAGTTGSRTLAANGMATVVKIAATEWIINGVGLT